jgi:hypothetical protein
VGFYNSISFDGGQGSREIMKAMLKMIKIDIEGLKRAYNGE